jgi:hypothetical protein
MNKSHFRDTINMKKQGNITPPKFHNSSIAQSKDIKKGEVPNNLKV